ncbi:MAG TPA: class I SAM-dependent methyltransferase [bacterium]|jgi:SAM-dependent methyltransferase|nr:class I SAM-dependent methyltransferase [bacterium]
MKLEGLQKNWDAMGKLDPLYGVLSHEGKRGRVWDKDDFFRTGTVEIDAVLAQARGLGPLRLGQALDFGCAVGRLSQALARHFKQVVGVDIAPSMLAEARRLNRFKGRCRYLLNARPDLGLFKDSSFDLVYSVLVLQHMHPDYSSRYIPEFLRVLRPGGLAVFQIPAKAQYSRWRGLKVLAPKALLRAYRRLRYGPSVDPDLEIEMHGIAEEQVRALVQGGGGEILRWENDTYWVRKTGSKKSRKAV